MFAYLDNSATTRPCPEAVAAMVEALETGWGNPSSLYRFGMDAAHRLKAARDQVAKALGGGAGPGVFHFRRDGGGQLGHLLRHVPDGEAGQARDHHGCGASCGAESHEAAGGAGI